MLAARSCKTCTTRRVSRTSTTEPWTRALTARRPATTPPTSNTRTGPPAPQSETAQQTGSLADPCRLSPKQPRTRRHIPGRPPHAVGDGHVPSPPAYRLRVSPQASLDIYTLPSLSLAVQCGYCAPEG